MGNGRNDSLKKRLPFIFGGRAMDYPSPNQVIKINPTKSINEQDKERRKELAKSMNSLTKQLPIKSSNYPEIKALSIPSWEAMIPVIEGKTPLMIHANESRQIKAAVQWAEKRNFKFTLSGCPRCLEACRLVSSKKNPSYF